MLLQAVIQTSIPMTLDIESVDPDEILILKSISGLSSAGVTPFMGEFARDGSYYQGRRAKQRNPVLNFKVNPDFKNDVDATDIRNMLYRMFMEPQATTDAVQITLKDDRLPDMYFIGYTEGVEADQFSKELGASVSMLCTDPYLRSVDETVAETTQGWFSVPLDYRGSADTGVELTAKVLNDTSQIVIGTQHESLALNRSFVAGDIVTINTNQGSLEIKVNGVDSMTSFSSSSSWLRLNDKSIVIRIYGSVPNDGKVALTRYAYRAAWWGI